MSPDPENVPVIVGVGQINDRPDTPQGGLHSGELMVAALERADADAGGNWLGDCQSLALVDQISFRSLNPLTDYVADACGMTPVIAYQSKGPNGDSPILLLNEAANRIGSGEISIAAVTGGEALRTAMQLARAAAADKHAETNAVRAVSSRKTPGYRQTYGLSAPVDFYPLYENAGRAAYGQTLAEAQAESGAIWSQFSEVANANPHAWIHQPRSAAEIIEPTADNRPIAHPYTKLMVANSSVNQGAAFIIASLAETRRRGVPQERLIHIGYGAAAHESDDFLARDRYDQSPSMEVSLLKTLELNRLSVSDFDHVELYSCFPCVPKMARRIINWPLDRPASVFGGLTFGGGPIGNYMSHAVASMVDCLRETGGKGLLFANGGYATHNHTIVLSAQQMDGVSFPQDFDFQAEADAARGPVPELEKHYCGPATIESYTVIYARDGTPGHGVIVARTPGGQRTLANVPASDTQAIAILTSGMHEPVGMAGQISAQNTDAENSIRNWSFTA
ncbi:acetyl-CoA acetyltransferase [Altererythrobacter confluentis]|uniref:Acetyl-CoA acetyltransferase n=1 Tax=Allopontixanthobacter confluentis TaxID=1849021 RepID=A0A6L7GI01_9SPHN|nr:acetyl-CoA acetyltransferase [Allopontixanthobacter confluentis]MXP14914.1 acetyl-CoA acetyltransferase [Allopontixanthobacter confluentis]